MKRGILLIDRGSREQEVKDELAHICNFIKSQGGYDYVGYCFLEVVPPYIEDGVRCALEYTLDVLIIVPYFLYPGKKVKMAITKVMSLQKNTPTKFVVTRLLNLHKTMINLVQQRIENALEKNSIKTPKNEIDVLIIGHGSKDPNAQTAIKYVTDGIKNSYRNVLHCFLEIEQPNISQGFRLCQINGAKMLVVVLYFLHKGAHVKHDIYEDLEPAVDSSNIEEIVITEHIGADPKIIQLVQERICEVEKTMHKQI